MAISTLNPFTLRVRISQFFKEKGRMPSEEEIKEIDAKITTERIETNLVYGICGQGGAGMSEIVFKGKPFGECEHPDPNTAQCVPLDPKVAFTSYREHEHEDDDRIYQQLIKAQKELLKDKKVDSKYPKIVVCDLLDHIDGNPPVRNLPNDKIMESYRKFSKELDENFDYDESTGSLKRKENLNDNQRNQN